MLMKISARARTILAAVVAEYISTAEPVGSKAVTLRGRMNISPATVRHEMAELEEMGFLIQPHTSAGRVPTDIGFRFYVDSILEVDELEPELKLQLTEMMEGRSPAGIDQVLQNCGRMLSEVSSHMAVVASPDPEEQVFRHMEFIRLDNGMILVVLVSGGGKVQNRILEAEDNLSQDELDKLANYLNELLSDLTLSKVRQKLSEEMATEKARFDEILSRALELGSKALAAKATNDIFIEGQTKLMVQPEFTDISRLKGVFEAFEEKSILLRLVEKSMMATGVKIFIGAESRLAGLEEMTVVTSTYGGDNPLGVVGVIGPTRMEYSKVIPVVDYTARLISRIMTNA